MSLDARSLFRLVAFAEAISWAGLLIGMLFKYVISDNETGVHVFGPIHGAVFVAYVVAVLWASRHFRWSLPVVLVGLASSIPPFGSLVFEMWADRTGRLRASAPAEIGAVGR